MHVNPSIETRSPNLMHNSIHIIIFSIFHFMCANRNIRRDQQCFLRFFLWRIFQLFEKPFTILILTTKPQIFGLREHGARTLKQAGART